MITIEAVCGCCRTITKQELVIHKDADWVIEINLVCIECDGVAQFNRDDFE